MGILPMRMATMAVLYQVLRDDQNCDLCVAR